MAGKRYSDPNVDDTDLTINKVKYSDSDYTGSEAKQTVKTTVQKETQQMSDSKSSTLSKGEQTGSPNGEDNDKDGKYVDVGLVDKVNKDEVNKIQYIQQNNPDYFEEVGQNADDLLSGFTNADSGVTFLESEDMTLGTIINENGITYVDNSDPNAVTTTTTTTSGTVTTTQINPSEILSVSDVFAHPTNHVGTITSPFGFRILTNGGKWEFHGGTDIGAKNGTKVYAVYAGIIQHAYSPYVNQIESPKGSGINKYGQSIYRSPSGYGNSVWLVFYSPNDGKQYVAIYGHLQDVFVKAGDKVDKGQLLGTIGDTGFSYGNHLHFELRSNDPTKKTVLKSDYLAGYNNRKASGIQTGFYGVNRIKDENGDWVINNTTIFVDPKSMGII
jgi:murein DD-endopeptidase MepM/ murein hydrolase activator NlpD